MMARTRTPSATNRTLTSRTLTDRVDLGGMDDQITRTADRVRTSGSDNVHALLSARTLDDGRAYRTRCERELRAALGAVLTTDPVSCTVCAKYRKRGTRR